MAVAYETDGRGTSARITMHVAQSAATFGILLKFKTLHTYSYFTFN